MNRAVSLFLKPFVQSCSIAFISALIIVFAQIKLRQNVFADPISKIENIENDTKVKVGLNLQNFIKFNIVDNNFIADINLWFEFDPKEVSLEDIDAFSFSKGEILNKNSVLETRKDKIFIRYDLRLQFASNLNYKYFPLEDHKIYITLDNKNLNGKKVNFISDKTDTSVSDTLYTPGWKVLNFDAQSGIRSVNLGANNVLIYPRVIFSVDFMQASLRKFIFILLPILIALLIALCSFAISWRRDFSTIIGIASGSLVAMVGYRYVIEKISPKTSYYMLSDHIFTFFLLLLFIIFFIDIFFRDSLEKHRNARGIVVFCFYVVVIIGWFYLLFIW
jgi:hypothetical protein